MDTSKLSSNRFDNTSMISIAKTNRTIDKLLPKNKKSNNEHEMRLDVRKDKTKVMEMMNDNDSFMEDQAQYLVSEELKEITPDDFGYFTLFHTGNEDLQLDIKHSKLIFRGEEKVRDFYVPGNFIDSLNEKKGTEFSSPLELLYSLAKQEKNQSNGIIVENPDLIKEKKANKKKFFGSTKSAGISKTITKKSAATEEVEEDELVKNTENSRINVVQQEDLQDGKLDEALKKNQEYVLRKVKYEVDLLKIQLEKFQDYKKNDPLRPVTIISEEPYLQLEEKSKKFLNKFDKFIEETKVFNSETRMHLQMYSHESREYLYDFMAGIIRHYEKSVKEKRSANEKAQNYIKWKTKLSQLVGIWDLLNSNGTEIKTTYKYLLLKRFLMMRAVTRQLSKEFIKLPEEKKGLMGAAALTGLFGGGASVLYPIAVIKETDLLRLVMDIVVAVLLLYSFMTVPFRLFLGVENKTFKLIEKFVDMYLYIDIMVTFRTSHKDKFNEDIFDIKEITLRYLYSFFSIDLISTVPWYFFFIDSAQKEMIRLVTHVLKIFRIIKLLPILGKLEQLKAANYVRLVKLLLIYFLMTHWMACIMFYGVTDAVSYGDLSQACYLSNLDKNKFTLTNTCKYILSFYDASYTIPGQYTSYMNATETFANFNEYIILLFEFLIGQFVSAYTFGGITSIIVNLDQGSNFFTEKTDLLREHMLFYDIEVNVQNDVRVYYDYLWQRHKDVIYGKHHFNLLSKSLREKFENFNLLGNEIYLYTFHKLNNEKLIGHILREMRKLILFPYEILFEEGSLVDGLYILTNGDIEFNAVKIENAGHAMKSVEFAMVMKEIEKRKNDKEKNFDEVASDLTVIFPLVSAFIKTGRTYQRCYATDFTDLLFLPMASFDEIIISFPVEMHSLKHDIMHFVEQKKLFDNMEIFKALSAHSARSVGKNFEKEYTKLSIWIPIPIPISQRKIATSYIESFVKKVKNQWREILVTSDMNICLNSMMVVGFLRSDKNKAKNKDEGENEKNALIQQGDQLDVLKNLSKTLSILSTDFVNLVSTHLQE
jgi:hypothetical protein